MLREVSPPSAEPVSLFEARLHLRQAADGDSPNGDSPAYYEPLPDNSWMNATITAARQWAEGFLGYPLTDAVYVETYSCFAGGPYGPISTPWRVEPDLVLPDGASEVLEVAYLDADNALQVMAPSTYDYDPFSTGIYLDARPSLSARSNAIRVKFRGSFGGDSPRLPVPEVIKHAILLVIGFRNENRASEVIPLGAEELLRPLKTSIGMA